MKYTVQAFDEKFRTFIGDSSIDLPSNFVINSLNWAFNELPRIPKLDKIFSKHYTKNLDAKNHYRFPLNGDFRRITDIPMITFLSSTGGEPCPIKICNKDDVEFYERNGVPQLKHPGTPCEYTIEQIGDEISLVFDRPLDIPLIIDYICYGFPKPVQSPEDEIDISAIAENLILSLMRGVYYWESDDFAFAGDVLSYLDNKAVAEAVQLLHHRFGVEENIILGER